MDPVSLSAPQIERGEGIALAMRGEAQSIRCGRIICFLAAILQIRESLYAHLDFAIRIGDSWARCE